MTPRPRSKRTTSDSSSASSSSSKGGAKKPSSRRRSAGGAAEKRPPRVSLPPSMGAAKPKATSRPAPKKAAASKPAPKAPVKKPASAKPAQSSARSAAPQRPAAQRPPERTQPARPPQPRQQPQRPAQDHRSSAPHAPAPAPQALAPQQPPAPRPPQQHQQGGEGGQRPAQPTHRADQGRPPQQGGYPQPRPQGQQQPPRPQQGQPGQGGQHGQHGQGGRGHSGAGNNQHPQHGGGRPPQQQFQQRPPQQQQQQRGYNQPQRGQSHNQQQNQPQRRDEPHGQHGQHAQHNRPPQQFQQQQRPQHQDQRAPVSDRPAPHAPAAHAPAVPASAPAPKQQLGNETAADFNKKAFEEIFSKDIPFTDLGLNEWLLKGITEAGFVYPTSIQAKLIPTILTGKDVLGQAKTGTGKTAAFALPMLNAIGKGESFGGLVLVPTRELALQVAADFRELGKYTGLNVLPVYGGQNIATQAKHLSHGPEIIVATPGRVMDMAQRGYLHHHNVKMVVLDEVDRMLDIGFRDDIKRILSACPRERQTVFVSATMQPEIEQLARTFARDCEKIIASAGALTVAMVKQFYLPVEPWDKKQLLLHLLTHESPALTVVFCRTKRTVDNLTEYLGRKGIDAHAIHGDMQQGKRNRVIEQLRSGKLAVLIASDLASRGLDVEGITHVINYDLPEDPDLYVHRIGRTARAGRDGVAWALVTPEQGDLLTQIEHLINAEIPKLDYPDFKPGPLPADVLAEREGAARRAEQAKSFNRFAQSFHAPGANLPPPADHASPGPSGMPSPVVRPAYAAPAAALDAAKFPGGIVPSKMPPRLMYGKVKSARSMRQAPPPPAAPGGPGANAET